MSIYITFFNPFHPTSYNHENIFKFFATSNLNTYIVKYQKMKTEEKRKIRVPKIDPVKFI